MPVCPICRHQLPKPPKDVRDWFRCEKCGTPLQVSSSLSKTLYWASIFGGLVLSAPLALLSMQYFEGRELTMYFIAGLLGGAVLSVYAGLARFFWSTKFLRLRPCDPYGSLNLSDDPTKFRGHASQAPAHNPFRNLIAKLPMSRFSHPCPACSRIFGPAEVRERNIGNSRCPACGEWLEYESTNNFRTGLVSILLALILSWQLGYRGVLFSFVLVFTFLIIFVTTLSLSEFFCPSGYKRAGS